MRPRTLAAAVLLFASTSLAACSSDNVLGIGVAGSGGDGTPSTGATARVRFANATGTSLDVASAGTVAAGSGALGFAGSSGCLTVSATSPLISVRPAGSTNAVATVSSGLQSGSSYTMIAWTDAVGVTRVATIADAGAPPSGQSVLRAFNASAATLYDVYVTAPGASLATATPTFAAVLGGTSSTTATVSATTAQQVRVTASGSKSVLLDLGNLTLLTGQSMVLVIAPPDAGSIAPRAFVVAGC
jgi:hypothetical protein